jgi:hypothetical protein
MLAENVRKVHSTPDISQTASSSMTSQTSSSSMTNTHTAPSLQQEEVPITSPVFVQIKGDLAKIGRKLVRLVKLNNSILVDKFELEKSHLTKIKKEPGSFSFFVSMSKT